MFKKKVNLHITDKCNFKCAHCFGKFAPTDLRFEDWKKVIDNICKDSSVVAINVAGGEPFLHPDLERIVSYIKDEKQKVISIVTNGFFLDTDKHASILHKVDMLGVSIDSFNTPTNALIGRHQGNNQLNLDNLKVIFQHLKERTNCEIKINTVVNRLNCKEHIVANAHPLVKFVDKWKFFRCQPFDNGKHNNSNICISDAEFNQFLKNNNLFLDCADLAYKINRDNTAYIVEKTMRNTYIVVGNNGDLLTLAFGDNYTKIGNLLSDDFCTLMQQYPLDIKGFSARY